MQPQTNNRFRRVRGFTMIEAVVSLAIVLLAVAALLPVLSEARTQAVASACLANQMALGMGFSGYVVDYQQIPGLHWQEGAYWAKPWGQGTFYSGMQAWMPNGDDFWNDYLYGSSDPKPTGFSGIGYVYPYLAGTDSTNVEAGGRTFYCPGTTASFESASGGYPYIENQSPWYNTWTGESNTLGGFGQQGRGTLTTYYYRSGMYEKQDLPDTDSSWGGWSWPPGSNWAASELSRPTSTWVQNKPMLTCFWYGYRDEGPDSGWNELPPDTSTIPHEGTRTNLLYTDGSARTWELPSHLSPIWAWFDYQYGPEGFRTGSLSTGFIIGYPGGDFRHQIPWWWVEARRANE